jgi:hypothetical protein
LSRSRRERERRKQQTEDAKRIEAAWFASLPDDVRSAFVRDSAAARARGPLPPQPDMAPGTRPNPPRPGHEPRPSKDATNERSSRR